MANNKLRKKVEEWGAEEGVTFARSLRDAVKAVDDVEMGLRRGLMSVPDMMEVELPEVLDAFETVGFPKAQEAHREVVFRVRAGDFERARLEILSVFVYMTGLN